MKVVRCLTVAFALATPTALFADEGKDVKTEKMSEQKSTDEQAVRVKAQVVPAIAGIEVADKAAAAVYELATLEKLEGKDAKKTLGLAKQGIQMAMTRADALGDMKQLSTGARSEAKTLKTNLQAARTTLQQLDKKVSGRIQRDDLEQIREQTKSLHTSLVDAASAAEQIARAYDVSTDLEFGG